MNKTISAHKEQQVKTWAAIISDCKEAKESGRFSWPRTSTEVKAMTSEHFLFIAIYF